jgi:hypothetical protein
MQGPIQSQKQASQDNARAFQVGKGHLQIIIGENIASVNIDPPAYPEKDLFLGTFEVKTVMPIPIDVRSKGVPFFQFFQELIVV